MSTSSRELAERFLALHQPGNPLLLPNPWDVGSAKLFASLGYEALATTSSGFAATLGRADGEVTLDEVLQHSRELASAVNVPVSADLENGFADDPQAVHDAVLRAAETGLAGASIEDWSGTAIYDFDQAVERVRAAVTAAEASGIVLTARAENLLRGVQDLDDTIRRLRAYQDVGAPVLYAPGLVRREDIARVVAEVERPLNVLIVPRGPTVSELAECGVARISVGGAFHLLSLGAVTKAAQELLGSGAHDFWTTAKGGRRARDKAFREDDGS